MREIPYARVVCDGRELSLVREVLESGWLTTAGKAHEFERRFGEAVGARYACAVNSCTAAMHLALESLGVRSGTKVFVPTLTFTATAEVIRYMSADPIFLDPDYGTRNLTPETVANAMERHPDVRVLMVVHFGGQAAGMTVEDGEGILDVCRQREVAVVEDAAHAFPTSLNGRMVGSMGDVTCFSFYANKTITTGEGGMLTTNDERIFKRSSVMRLHGIDRDIWDRFSGHDAGWEYDVVAPGYKYNMPDVNAAIGLAQLERADEFRRERQRCAEFYYRVLCDLRGVDLPELEGPMDAHSWHLFTVVLNDHAPINRDEFIRSLADRGIGTSVHYKPLHRMSYYRDRYRLDPADFPNAERYWQGCVSLPIYPTLTDRELGHIVGAIHEAVGAVCSPGVDFERAGEAPAETDEGAGGIRSGASNDGAQASPRKRIGLSIPHMGGSELRWVQEAFRSNWLSTVGPNITSLEDQLHAMTGRVSLGVSSGTVAIQLGLRLLGVGEGDEVICPTLTFVASCNPILYLGAKPVFIDSESESWNLDADLLEDFLSRRATLGDVPKALIAVHLFGQCTDMDRIMEVCRSYGVVVLEDAAEALGAKYKGREAGIFGDVGVFSFNGNKIITGTTGGMLVSSHDDWIEKARFWSSQACDPDPLHNYVHSELGYNYRISNVVAGIALGQLEVLEERVQQRRAVFRRYAEAFADLPGIEPQPEAVYGHRPSTVESRPHESQPLAREDSSTESRRSTPASRHTRWLSCFLIDEAEFGLSRDDLIRCLDEVNVESRPVWKPMHTQPLYRGYECVGSEVAEELHRKGICLPSSSCLTIEEQEFVIGTVQKSVKSEV